MSACVPGNDLGRVLRWGAGYSGEDPLSVLLSVDEADAVLMDRWTILLDAHDTASAENGTADAEPPKVQGGPPWGALQASAYDLVTRVTVGILLPATLRCMHPRHPLCKVGS